MLDSFNAAKIQSKIRGFLLRKKIHIKTIGPGIINVCIKALKPSHLLGNNFESFDDLRSGFEVMLTIINPKQVKLLLATDQGSPDHLMKFLKQENVSYGAVINGGFYAINRFYNLPESSAIGLHRFEQNYYASVKYRNRNRRDKKLHDNTQAFFDHAEASVSEAFEEYKNTDIESQLHLRTQLPDAVKGEYGLIRITLEGTLDIQPMHTFKSDDDFDTYQKDAQYLLSSGPMLVWDNQRIFTEEKLVDKKYQFEEIRKVFDNHPSSVPPGSFYHADQPNPRSAIALTQDENLMMVTIKGDESPANRDGLTLPQFAQLMQAFHAKVALNLDGGYSACQGVYNSESMFTPRFIKSCSNQRILPCSIMAQEPITKPTTTKRRANVPSDAKLGDNRTKKKIIF